MGGRVVGELLVGDGDNDVVVYDDVGDGVLRVVWDNNAGDEV